MARKADMDRVRICLDCKWMKHSREDWERGKCEYHNKEIGYVNNHDWCNHWGRVTYGNDLDEDYDESVDSFDI